MARNDIVHLGELEFRFGSRERDECVVPDSVYGNWETVLQNSSMDYPSTQHLGPQGMADQALPIDDVVNRIERINEGLRQFWSNAAGWAPDDAAELMSKSRLDWQVSLSRSLRHWIVVQPGEIESGDLILAWTNLGSLIEGSIKLFLAVYYQDYKNDLDTLKKTQAWHKKNEKLLDPDGLALDVLVDYCEKAALFDHDHLAFFEDGPITTKRDSRLQGSRHWHGIGAAIQPYKLSCIRSRNQHATAISQLRIRTQGDLVVRLSISIPIPCRPPVCASMLPMSGNIFAGCG